MDNPSRGAGNKTTISIAVVAEGFAPTKVSRMLARSILQSKKGRASLRGAFFNAERVAQTRAEDSATENGLCKYARSVLKWRTGHASLRGGSTDGERVAQVSAKVSP